MSVTEAAASGSLPDLLVALRTRIASVIDDGCAPRDLVGLSRRLIDVSNELHKIKDAEPTVLHLVPDGNFDPKSV